MLLEWRKWRHFPAVWLIAGLPLLMVGLLTLSFYGRLQAGSEIATGPMFLQSAAAFWGLFLGTPLCLLLTTFAIAMEQSMWQQLRLHGISPAKLMAVKVISAWLLCLLAYAVFIVLLAAAGAWLNLPDWNLSARLPLLIGAGLTLLPVVAVQAWISLRFDHFLLAMGAGMTGHFLCLFVNRTVWGQWLPWAPTLEFLQVRGQDARTDGMYLILVIITGLIFTVAACLDSQRRFGKE